MSWNKSVGFEANIWKCYSWRSQNIGTSGEYIDVVVVDGGRRWKLHESQRKQSCSAARPSKAWVKEWLVEVLVTKAFHCFWNINDVEYAAQYRHGTPLSCCLSFEASTTFLQGTVLITSSVDTSKFHANSTFLRILGWTWTLALQHSFWSYGSFPCPSSEGHLSPFFCLFLEGICCIVHTYICT